MLYAGYENCQIFRSDDGGEHWRQLPVTVRFPEVTVAPGANPAKRVLKLAANPATVEAILQDGSRRARAEAALTMDLVREATGLKA